MTIFLPLFIGYVAYPVNNMMYV